MALLLDPVVERPRRAPVLDGARWVVPGAAVAAVLVRLVFAGLPPGADEAGFLQVAAQWSPGGGSLYGGYWVDRPPLLITLFQLAAATGGIVSLRLLGCLAAASIVLLVAWTAGQVGGPRAARWSAATAAALTVSPLLGALEVNGELLAAPFVALGIGAAVAAVRESSPRRTLRWAVLSGAGAVAALLVKQNIADVLVFVAVLLVAGLARRTIQRRTAGRLVAGAALGGVGTLVVVAAWTVLHGTSLVEVYDAMYPFRLQAAHVLATDGGSQYAMTRVGHLSAAWLGSGLALLTVCLLLALVRSRLREPVLVALVVTVAFDGVSIALGGGYWLHYLVEMIVPLSVATGLGATHAGRWAQQLPRVAVALAAAAAVGSLPVGALEPSTSGGEEVGAAVRSVAAAGDTLTTLYGEPQVNFAAGLSSPYANLWSLPTKTLDPHLTALDTVLAGPSAPTWLVTSRRIATWGLDTARTQQLVDDRYHPVAMIDDQTIYLLDGADRATP